MLFRAVALALLLTGCGSPAVQTGGNQEEIFVPSSPDLQDVFGVAVTETPIWLTGDIDESIAGNQTGSILYPGGSAAIFFASIATHAAISSGTENARKSREQEQADEVTLPYIYQLGDTTNFDLLNGIEETAGLSIQATELNKNVEEADWVLTANPHFVLAQNKRQLHLINEVLVTAPGSEEPEYLNTIEISSTYKGLEDGDSDPWATLDGSSQLLVTMQHLFQDSVRYALVDSTEGISDGSVDQQTIRFEENGSTSFERGYLLNTDCSYGVIETLSKTLKIVPTENIQGIDIGGIGC